MFEFEDPGWSAEMKWKVIAAHQKNKLNASAWTQLPDSGLSMAKRMEWQAYRDDLRSVQDDFASPDDVIFPTEPAEE